MKKGNWYLVAGLVIIAAIWHIVVVNSKKVQLDGLFREKPREGYAWTNSGTHEPRFFWNRTEAEWVPGFLHPTKNVFASGFPGVWWPRPGYLLTDQETLSTTWTSGLSHPRMKATSAEQEGYWMPLPGYDFITDASGKIMTAWKPGTPHSDGKMFASLTEGQWLPYLGYEWKSKDILGIKKELVWVPGLVYSDFHIVSGTREKSYIPFPGYQFIEPENSLEVQWVAGLTHPTDAAWKSGTTEGTWENINQPEVVAEAEEEPTALGYLLRGLLIGFTGELVEKTLDQSNPLSDELYKKGLSDIGKGFVKAIKE